MENLHSKLGVVGWIVADCGWTLGHYGTRCQDRGDSFLVFFIHFVPPELVIFETNSNA